MFIKLKYKYKRFLAWCGVWDAKHYIDNLHNPDLNNKEELFIKMWIDALSDNNYSLYIFNTDLTSYELHNYENKTLLTLTKDHNYGILEIFKFENNIPHTNNVKIPKSVADRLVNRFISEMENRTKVLKNFYEINLLEVLK